MIGPEPFRILLVEDNPADAYLFRKALENAEVNFELTILSDGAEALAFVRRQGRYAEWDLPHLAVIDLNLPKNGGFEVLEAAQETDLFKRLPIVVASSSKSPRDRAMVGRFGIERYVIKPADLKEFLALGSVLKQILAENRLSAGQS